tara:strand:+ start:954 stop:1370 length:417 start_codon:yes stop_codon:yes gene_type:complete
MKEPTKNQSNIPSAVEPVFEACIPEHLLNKIKDETNRWMLEEVSKMQQNNQWQNKKIHDIYEYTRTINGQVVSLLEFRKDLLMQMEAEHKLNKVKQENNTHTTKLYKVIVLAFLTIVYPLFLMQWTTGSITEFFKFMW